MQEFLVRINHPVRMMVGLLPSVGNPKRIYLLTKHSSEDHFTLFNTSLQLHCIPMLLLYLGDNNSPTLIMVAFFVIHRRLYSSLLGQRHHHDPIVNVVSEAILNSTTKEAKPLNSNRTLISLLPSFTPQHFTSLITANPFNLPPLSLFSFYGFLSSVPDFRLTLPCHVAMAGFLASHRLLPQSQSVISSLVARSGRNSAFPLFDAFRQAGGEHVDLFLFEALVIAYADAGFIWDGIQMVRMMRRWKLGDAPSGGCWYLIDRMLHCSDCDSETVWGFYLELLDCGLPGNSKHFNILMRGFCRERKVNRARKVFDEMHKRGVVPNAVTYNTLINGYCKVGNLDEGFKLKRVMEEKGIGPDRFTYSSLVNGLFRENKSELANELFEEMCKGKGLVPNDVIWTTLIHGHSRNERIDLAMEVYRKMLDAGVKADVVAYNALINGFSKVGNLTAASELFDEMKSSGLKPDKITYTVLIDGFFKEGYVESALAVRKEMVQQGVKLDDIAFTAFISGLCHAGRMAEAESVMREMVRSGMKPDDATYNAVMDGFCKNGDTRMGFKLLREMQNSGSVPGVITYNVLMNGLCKKGQLRNARALLDEMMNSGMVPDDITYNILLDGHCKHGNYADIDAIRNEKGLVLDYASYTALLEEMSKARKSHQRQKDRT